MPFLLLAILLFSSLTVASDPARADHEQPVSFEVSLSVRLSTPSPAPPDPAFPESGKVTIAFDLFNREGKAQCARVRSTLTDPAGKVTFEVLDRRSGLISGRQPHTIAEREVRIPKDAAGVYVLKSMVQTVAPVEEDAAWGQRGTQTVCREKGRVITEMEYTTEVLVAPMAGRGDFEAVEAIPIHVRQPDSLYYTAHYWEFVFRSSGRHPGVVIEADMPHHQDRAKRTITHDVVPGENRVRFQIETDRRIGTDDKIRFTIDPRNAIPELREGNNRLEARPITADPSVANLRIDPTDPAVGQPVSAYVDVRNERNVIIPAEVPVRFTFGGRSTDLPVGDLAPGETRTIGPFTFTPETRAEKARLRAELDPEGKLPGDRGNNRAERVLHVPAGVDGRIGQIRIEPELPALGVEATAVVRVHNEGAHLSPVGELTVAGPGAKSHRVSVPEIPGRSSIDVRIPFVGGSYEGNILGLRFEYRVAGEHDFSDNSAEVSPWAGPAWELRTRVVSPAHLLEHPGLVPVEIEVRNVGAGASPAGTVLQLAPTDAAGGAAADRTVRVGIPAIPPGGAATVRAEVQTLLFERLVFGGPPGLVPISPGPVDPRLAGGSFLPFGTFRDAALRVTYAPESPQPGDALTVSVTVASVGDAILPAGIPVRAFWHDWQHAEFSTKEALPPGRSETFQIVRTVPADGKIGLMAFLRPDFAEGGLGAANNDAAFGEAGKPPDLRLSVEPPDGDGRRWAVVTNDGSDSATGSTIRVKAPNTDVSKDVPVPAVRRGATVRVPLDFPSVHGAGEAVVTLTPREPVAPSSVLEAKVPVEAIDATALRWTLSYAHGRCRVGLSAQATATGPIVLATTVGPQGTAHSPVVRNLPSVLPSAQWVGVEIGAPKPGEWCWASIHGDVKSAYRKTEAEEKRDRAAEKEAPFGGLVASLAGLAVGAHAARRRRN